MKKYFVLLSSILLFFCSCTSNQISHLQTEDRQVLMTKGEIINSIEKESKIIKDKIVEKNIWLQYADIDEDPELEMLLSYRYELHKGYFFIFDYQNGKYVTVFTRPWPVEKMSMKEVIYASGSNTVHILTANILQMQKGKVNIIWSGVYDKYDYTKLTNGNETHARYYIDTNGMLNYFYKFDKNDQNGMSLKTEFISEKYTWDANKNMFIKE